MFSPALFTLACRYDAIATNPCRDVGRISVKPKRPPTALTIDALKRLHQWLSCDGQSVERDLPDLVLFLMATGLRIGEALAVQWRDLDLDECTVEVRGTVLRLRAGGLIIKSSPKSAAGRRILELPLWAVHNASSDANQMMSMRMNLRVSRSSPRPLLAGYATRTTRSR